MGNKEELAVRDDVQREANYNNSVLSFIDIINKIVTNLCGVAMLIMVISVGLGILNRFVFVLLPFSFSMPWTEEVTRYLMTWVVFLGAAVAARKDKLIGLGVLIHALPRRLGSSMKYFSIFISLAFYLSLVWVGLQWFELGKSQSSPVLKLPMVIVYSAMSLGFTLSIVNTLALLYEVRKSKKSILEIGGEDASDVLLKEEKK